MSNKKKLSTSSGSLNASAHYIDIHIREMKKQLLEQINRFESRTETKNFLLGEVSDYLRKRSDLEAQYAKDLEKLSERLEKNISRDPGVKHFPSVAKHMHQLSSQTKVLSQQRYAYLEMLQNDLAIRIDLMAKDSKYIFQKMKPILQDIHDNYLKHIKDMQDGSKDFATISENFNKCHEKHHKAKATKDKNPNKKGVNHKEEFAYNQLIEARNKRMKSRVDMALSISDVNSATSCYFNESVHKILSVLDLDYHQGLKRIVNAHHQLDNWLYQSAIKSSDILFISADSISHQDDEKEFLFNNAEPFKPPMQFNNESMSGDELMSSIQDLQSYQGLYRTTNETHRLSNANMEELKKTLHFMDDKNLSQERVVFLPNPPTLPDSSNPFLSDIPGGGSQGEEWRRLNESKKENYLDYYLQKFKSFLLQEDVNVRSKSRVNILEQTLENSGASLQLSKVPSSEIPDLFKGSILKYIAATGYDIPPIIMNCVTTLEKLALELEGLFRIPGPAGIIEEYKIDFEAGLNPLSNLDTVDLYAVAGVLKSYLRDLKDPLFPCEEYDNFLSCCRIVESEFRITNIKECILKLPKSLIRVMTYLFNFLSKVSIHSSKNKMNSVNLATVFGPTLSRAPPGTNYLQQQMDIVYQNILIQTCIDHFTEIFPAEPEFPPPPEAEPENSEENEPLTSEVLVNGTLKDMPHIEENNTTDIDELGLTDIPDLSPTQAESDEIFSSAPNLSTDTETKTAAVLEDSGDKVKSASAEMLPSGESGSDSPESGDEFDIDELSLAKAIYSFTARNDKELSVTKGDMIKVIAMTPDKNWWEAIHDNKRGYIPSNYVIIIDNADQGNTSETNQFSPEDEDLVVASPIRSATACVRPIAASLSSSPGKLHSNSASDLSLPAKFSNKIASNTSAAPQQKMIIAGASDDKNANSQNNSTKPPPVVRPKPPSFRRRTGSGSEKDNVGVTRGNLQEHAHRITQMKQETITFQLKKDPKP